jgi:hypothetical protein
MLYNVILDEIVIVANLGEDKIHCDNCRYFKLRLSLVAAFAAYVNIEIEVVMVDRSYKMVRDWRLQKTKF